MRLVGEKNISSLAQATKSPVSNRIRNIPVKCKDCGYTAKFSINSIRNIDKSKWLCRECKKKSQNEVNQAIIALAKRKAAMKRN